MALRLIVLLLLSGCVSERVVLLPSPDGKSSALRVRNPQGELMLDRPYAESVQRNGLLSARQASAAEVSERYAATLAAQPPTQQNYLLFFETGSDVPTADSLPVLQQAMEEIGRREAAEVMLIGHTDRVGDVAENEALSQRRVVAVQALLLAGGVAESSVELAYRGENEPLVATPDGVSDPRNRRVEISVR